MTCPQLMRDTMQGVARQGGIELGKIFDITAQRDRAMKEYQLALQTEDNTLDALSEAEQLLQKPYEWPRTQ